jgi:hypothetical protein
MKYLDLDIRKSLHINLTKGTHAALKMEATRYHLSMQEILEAFACAIAENEPWAIEFLCELQVTKRDAGVKRFAKTDAETIFEAIEQDTPLD